MTELHYLVAGLIESVMGHLPSAIKEQRLSALKEEWLSNKSQH